MALKILIFSMAMHADYSFELISIETYAPKFIGHNKFFLGSVGSTNCIWGYSGTNCICIYRVDLPFIESRVLGISLQ